MSETTELSAQQRRVALEALPRDRLSPITERFELAVADRRVAANRVDAIVRARRLDFAELVGLLSRDEPKGMSEALGLDTGGREKQALIDRIVGAGGGKSSSGNGNAAASAGKRPNGGRRSTAAPMSLDITPATTLTRGQLEGTSWPQRTSCAGSRTPNAPAEANSSERR